MKYSKTNTNFHSAGGAATVTGSERLNTQSSQGAEALAGISYLPKTKFDQIQNMNNMTPRTIKKKLNSYIENKIMPSKEATSLFFEELSVNTGKIHRHALRAKLDTLDNQQVRYRGQTAEHGIRLNSKLAGNAYAAVAAASGRYGTKQNFMRETSQQPYGDGFTTQADSKMMTSKSGFSHYPGQPFKVGNESVMGQTLNKFELGQQGNSKFKQIDGTEYYKQHIHQNQKQRLRKYVKDPSGHAANTKNFKPLSDVAKPSMEGRVQMYMQKLNDDENKEKMRNQRASVQQMDKTYQSQMGTIDEKSHFKSQTMIPNAGALAASPARNDYSTQGHTVDHMNQTSQSKGLGGMTNEDYSAAKPVAVTRSQMRSSSMTQRQEAGHVNKQRRKIDMHQKPAMAASINSKLSKKPTVEVKVGDDDLTRKFDSKVFDYDAMTPAHTIPRKRVGSNKVKVVADEKDKTMTMPVPGILAKMMSVKGGSIKQPAKGLKEKTSDQKKPGFRKTVSLEHYNMMTDSEKLYHKIKKFKIFTSSEAFESLNPNAHEGLTAEVKKTYMNIYNCSDDSRIGKKDETKDIKNLKNASINKKTLMNYLKKRYTHRLAQKMTALFDWSNLQIDYDVFYSKLENLLVRPRDCEDEEHHLRIIKKFAFEMLDMNCDRMVCEVDLFSFLEMHTDKDYFKETLIYDQQDIYSALKLKNRQIVGSGSFGIKPNGQHYIKNLDRFIEWSGGRKKMRKQTHDEEVYISAMQERNNPRDAANAKRDSMSDSNDIYSCYGPGYSATFKKMAGSKLKKKHLSEATNTVKSMLESTLMGNVYKKDLIDGQLREMRTQGAQQFTQEHKKHALATYLISKKNDIYNNKENRAFFTQDEFMEKVHFKFGIPLIVLDFLDYVTGSEFIKTVQTFVNPQTHIDRFDHQNHEFGELRGQVDYQFSQYIFQLFNALGVVDIKELPKAMPLEEKETKQYLTFESLKSNLPKVFGIRNDFFAEMLFSYISDHAPMDHKINYMQFFIRLMPLWLKKKDENIDDKDVVAQQWNDRIQKQHKKQAMKHFMYDFIRIGGNDDITVLDLIKMNCYFKGGGSHSQDADFDRELSKYNRIALTQQRFYNPHGICDFGQECELLLNEYKRKNIKPKYVHARTEFTFNQYQKFVPYSCLIEDLEYAFCGQIMDLIQKQDDVLSNDENKRVDELEEFPLSSWKMKSIFDENDQPEEYWQDLERRVGKTAQNEVNTLQKQNKMVIEKKIDRGFDIIRTWDIAQVKNDQ